MYFALPSKEYENVAMLSRTNYSLLLNQLSSPLVGEDKGEEDLRYLYFTLSLTLSRQGGGSKCNELPFPAIRTTFTCVTESANTS